MCSKHQSLRNIVAAAHTISPSASALSLVAPPAGFAIDFYLPPPPSIHEALSSFNMQPRLASKLAAVYQELTSQLRDASQDKLRRVVFTCKQIPTSPGLPLFDPHNLYLAATDVYMRTLQKMTQSILSSVQKYNWENISLSPSYGPSRPLYSGSEFQRNDRLWFMSSFPRDSTAAVSFKVKPTYGRPVHKPPILLQEDGRAGSHQSLVTSVNAEQADSQVGLTSISDEQLPCYCYPTKYGHSHAPSSRSLPSSSKEFLLQTVAHTTTRPKDSTTNPTSASFAEDFSRMSIGWARKNTDTESKFPEFTSPVSLCSTARSRPIADTLCSSGPSTQNTAPRISLDISQSTSAKSPRRKLAPMPKRFAPSCSPDSLSSTRVVSTDPEPRPISLTRKVSAAIAGSSTQQIPSVSASSVVCTIPSKPRKLASLPQRRPHHHVPVSRTSTSSMSSMSSLPFTPRLPVTTISRTPSLVSLTSSRSNSPTFRDELETPPSSPDTAQIELKYPAPSIDSEHNSYCSMDGEQNSFGGRRILISKILA